MFEVVILNNSCFGGGVLHMKVKESMSIPKNNMSISKLKREKAFFIEKCQPNKYRKMIELEKCLFCNLHGK